jgi:hypothetical protein
VAITPRAIRLGDDREGAMRPDILAMRKDPARKAEREKLLAGRGASFPVKTESFDGPHLHVIEERILPAHREVKVRLGRMRDARRLEHTHRRTIETHTQLIARDLRAQPLPTRRFDDPRATLHGVG